MLSGSSHHQFHHQKVNIPDITLNNGKQMPALGYGTFLGLNEKFEFDYSKVPEFVEALSHAIDIGYRHIDSAHLYRVEPEVGAVIADKIRDGVVRREELFVVAKVFNHDHRPADVEKSTRDSLRRMKLDYVDLLLMHWPLSISTEGEDEKIDYLETWSGLEAVHAKGLARSIGVSNFSLGQMERLVANCKVLPVVNQIEINLNLGQKELVDYCQSQKVAVVAYTPFGTMIPRRDLPSSPEPKMNNPTLVAIGKKYGKSVTQIVLRYLYQRGIVSIPKTVTKARVLENASIFDFELDAGDVDAMAKFDTGYRTVRPVFWQHFANYPFDVLPGVGDMATPKWVLQWKNGANADID